MTHEFHGLLLPLQDHIREYSEQEIPSENLIKNCKFLHFICSLFDEQYLSELMNIGNENNSTATENLAKWHQSDSEETWLAIRPPCRNLDHREPWLRHGSSS